MRIGVDASSWFNERGYGRYTRELLAAMVAEAPRHRFLCFVDQRDVPRFALPGGNVQVRGVALDARPVEAAAADGSRSPLDMLRMTRAVAAERPDVLYFPTVYTFFPVPPGVRAAVTVHDAITERFPALTLPGARARLFWRAKVRLALLQARLVLTVSDYAAGELAQVLRVDRRRIRVTGEAPAPAYRPPADPAEVAAAARRAGLPEGARWFTYVGGFNPHKNVEALVRAHAALAREGDPPPRLVLAGTVSRDVFHSGLASIRAALAAAGTEELVHWPGFLPDEELALLHAGAVALVLPSLSEGFGLPAVEAAACGTPVVATTASPLPGLLAGGGLFVDPRDEAGLAAAMRRLLRDEPARRALGEHARERAAALSWAEAARRALAALEEAAA